MQQRTASEETTHSFFVCLRLLTISVFMLYDVLIAALLSCLYDNCGVPGLEEEKRAKQNKKCI
jgi:hypothetical protein